MNNNLLFDERPLVVQPQLAVMLEDVDCAIILQQVHYWLQKKQNFRDGRYWVYNSKSDWLKQFPWIKTEKRLERKFKKLKDMGVVVTANYNKLKLDRTLWYSIDYDALARMSRPYSQNDLMDTVTSTVPYPPNRPNGLGQNDLTNTIDYHRLTNIDYQKKENAGGGVTEEELRQKAHLAGLKDTISHERFINYMNEFSGDILLYVLEEAVKHIGKPNIAYIDSILNRYKVAGIKTIEQAKADSEKFASGKNKKHKAFVDVKNEDHNVTDEEAERIFFGDDDKGVK